jgi:hypothetical protein
LKERSIIRCCCKFWSRWVGSRVHVYGNLSTTKHKISNNFDFFDQILMKRKKSRIISTFFDKVSMKRKNSRRISTFFDEISTKRKKSRRISTFVDETQKQYKNFNFFRWNGKKSKIFEPSALIPRAYKSLRPSSCHVISILTILREPHEPFCCGRKC